MINKIRTEWNAKLGVSMTEKPRLLHIDQGMIMDKLFYEEYLEYEHALDESKADKRLIGIADALGDMTYLLYGTINQYGFHQDWILRAKAVSNRSMNFHINELMTNIRKGLIVSIRCNLENIDSLIMDLWCVHNLVNYRDAVMEEIHRSNLTKLVGGKGFMKNDGKILKPASYQSPDLKFILS